MGSIYDYKTVCNAEVARWVTSVFDFKFSHLRCVLVLVINIKIPVIVEVHCTSSASATCSIIRIYNT